MNPSIVAIPAASGRRLALVSASPHPAPADREDALLRVRRVRRYVQAHQPAKPGERFAYLKRIYD